MNTLLQTMVEGKLLGVAPPLRPLDNNHSRVSTTNNNNNSNNNSHFSSPTRRLRRQRRTVLEDIFSFGKQQQSYEEEEEDEPVVDVDNHVELDDPRDLMTLLLPILQDDKQWHRLQRSMREGEHGTTGMTSLTTRFFVKELIREHYAKATQQERHELFAPILAEAHITDLTTTTTAPAKATVGAATTTTTANNDTKHFRKLSDSSVDTVQTYCSYSSGEQCDLLSSPTSSVDFEEHHHQEEHFLNSVDHPLSFSY